MAVPFLAMALYEPLAAGNPQQAIDALHRTGVPAAAVPLIDYLASGPAPEPAAAALAALRGLTGATAETPDQWQKWLHTEGLAFLRWSKSAPSPALTPAPPR
jgi:hypothetical protein